MIDTAMQLAAKYHEGQLDKSSIPYILHIMAVVLKCQTEEQQVVAALHDIVEDTACTLPDLRRQFPYYIVDAVDAITFRKGIETRDEYYDRVKENPIALAVKKADLAHNIERLANLIGTPDYNRMSDKYQHAYFTLYDIE